MSQNNSETTAWPQADNDYFEQQHSPDHKIGFAPPPSAFCRQQSVASISDHQELSTEPSSTKLIKSKKDLLVIISMAMLFFMGMCAFSVIAPFFTIEVRWILKDRLFVNIHFVYTVL